MISAAADAGYQGVSLTAGGPLIPASMQTISPPHPLVGDRKLRRATMARAKDTGIKLDLLEGLVTSADFTSAACREFMDVAEEMDIKHLAAVNVDTDRGRMSESLAATCEMAGQRGLIVNIEFMPLLPFFTSVEETAKMLGEKIFPGLTMMVDVLHLCRSGGTVEDMSKIAPLVTGSQFSDGALARPSDERYLHQAMYERDIPGEGAFPLEEIFNALPDQAIVYLEVPKKSFRDRGLDAVERARRILDGMRRVEAMARH